MFILHQSERQHLVHQLKIINEDQRPPIMEDKVPAASTSLEEETVASSPNHGNAPLLNHVDALLSPAGVKGLASLSSMSGGLQVRSYVGSTDHAGSAGPGSKYSDGISDPMIYMDAILAKLQVGVREYWYSSTYLMFDE